MCVHLISRKPRGGWSQTDRGSARRALGTEDDDVNITEDVRKYAAEQEISEADALQVGMEQRPRIFAETGSKQYSKT